MLLALDTSGPFCSTALLKQDGSTTERSDEIGRGHAEHLMPMLEELLEKQSDSWADINVIACTTGPGSFTGLRVGLAAARGLALGLNCPCIGVTVFEAFSYGISDGLAVTIDARRGEIWMQLFDGETHGSLAVKVEQVHEFIPADVGQLIGSGAPLVAEMSDRFTVINDKASPPISAVAKIASGRKLEGAEKPKPLYLRSPDAKPQNQTRVAG